MTIDRDVVTIVFDGYTAVGAGAKSTNNVVVGRGLNSVDIFVHDFGVGGHDRGGEFNPNTDFYFLVGVIQTNGFGLVLEPAGADTTGSDKVFFSFENFRVAFKTGD